MIEQTLQIGDININYKAFGVQKENNTICILHGWGGKSESWEKVGHMLAEKGYYIIIPDLPGFGKTKLDKVYTLQDYAILIEKFIFHIQANQEIILWGHSNGGAIAMTLAQRKNISIKQLILNNSAGIRNDTQRSLKRKILGTFTGIIKHFLKNKYIQNHTSFLGKIRRLFYRLIGGQDYLASENTPFLRETYLNMIQSDLVHIFPNISQKTLLIRGEKDSYTPLRDASIFKKNIPHSQLIILPNQKHGIHLHAPQLLVDTFLKHNF